MPVHWTKVWRLLKILTFDYGYLASVAAETPLDMAGAPYPWYTYPALEYLRQLDFSDKIVFEYGCGHSTLFWASRSARVISVEHNREWYELVKPRLPDGCTLLFEPESDAYAATIDRFSDGFDVIVVDGLVTGRTRLKCVRSAVRHLRDGGMIILDNSDWLPESSRHLRKSGLIEVDMTGFAPINDYTCTTSFYLHRGFAFKSLNDRQPIPGVGAHPYNWEKGAMSERLAAEREHEAV
jgi:spermidine synthase